MIPDRYDHPAMLHAICSEFPQRAHDRLRIVIAKDSLIPKIRTKQHGAVFRHDPVEQIDMRELGEIRYRFARSQKYSTARVAKLAQCSGHRGLNLPVLRERAVASVAKATYRMS